MWHWLLFSLVLVPFRAGLAHKNFRVSRIQRDFLMLYWRRVSSDRIIPNRRPHTILSPQAAVGCSGPWSWEQSNSIPELWAECAPHLIFLQVQVFLRSCKPWLDKSLWITYIFWRASPIKGLVQIGTGREEFLRKILLELFNWAKSYFCILIQEGGRSF